ncbi:baseplate multidomain protein megatron [Shimia sagamensis]|uniref:Phage tail protein n=1 Tax=Shimia sagamensis TaxID=1566352 RepID=A0ABY1NJK6_9RHOB|nr:glycoside hydrolase/phage tail family protein [Shimia sagamensis]SMP11365.1 Putative phage tail protein [Shimia sagamensis]
MATVILAAAGAAVGGAVGGGLAGVSSAAIGQLAGATLGRVIDQKLMGAGSDVIETGKINRFRLTGSAEGAAQARVFGRVRVAGQVIWATRFQESVSETGGGKGMPSQPKTRSYSYSVSLAIALCEGVILRVGRMWADGVEVGLEEFNLRVYTGGADQMPDPKIEAVEGAGTVPAYRGTAYVMIEDLPLERFGNRVPQFNFEVVRATPEHVPEKASDYSETVRAVALMPGTGEYALATSPVYCSHEDGETRVANEHTPSGLTNFVTSLQDMQEELPQCEAASLVVSWFGSDLRMAECALRPKVEDVAVDGDNMPWQVSGVSRAAAQAVEQLDGRPVYGGTPADAAVVQAIQHMTAIGTKVTFYPFILMEQMAENGLSDPWSNAPDQPVLPWRGRITVSKAPGRSGSPDGTALADAEVAAFFGSATAADFQVNGESVSYSGPVEWSYRRFILHYAALCAAAGGVEAFCIGSEMRGLTQVRGLSGFSAVAALRDLALEVRTLLGLSVKLGYAADWSEYFGYHPQDGSGDVYFHLDPLWADPNIDFIGIDNYMPLSDWRDNSDHLDALTGRGPQDVEYLKANIEGGEGYDWFYPSEDARAAQRRSEITDGAHQEPWVFRYKDLRNWWGQDHHDRVAGVRLAQPTMWVPQSKPIWFTEIGCAAIDKGPNQPNKFLDDKSSESAIPHFSTGLRNDEVQQRYYQAIFEHYSDAAVNPISSVYGAPMVDRDHMFAWAWDARPFPAFPNAQDHWSDGGNYAKGHWINGRVTNRSLASVVEEVCLNAGISAYDVSGLRGVVRGFLQKDVADGRAALQPLMLRHGFDAVERDGVLRFAMRSDQSKVTIDTECLVASEEIEGDVEFSRQADAELAGRVRLSFVQAEQDFGTVSEEAVLHDEATFAVAHSDVEEVLTRGEGRQTAERWLAEARVARDRVKLALPPSRINVGAGDLLEMTSGSGVQQNFRLDRLTQQGAQVLEGARTELALYKPSEMEEEVAPKSRFVPPVPVQSLFLDLPLMTGEEVPHAPHIAVTGRPWPGAVAIYSSGSDEGYELNALIEGSAIVGTTETALARAGAGTWDRGAALQVRMVNGALRSVSEMDVFNGKNVAFVGDGQPDRWEVFQYQDAELIGENRYTLSRRLRGQLGSDAIAPAVWPIGSWVVFLSSKVTQILLQRQTRGQPLNFRIGPAQRGLHDSSFTHHGETFSGVGLRPYAPVHLRCGTFLNGDIGLNWIRRTRIDADSWDGYEVPLGEESELYLLRIRRGSDVLREVHISEPQWLYSTADQAVDGGLADVVAEVSQVSSVTGPGPFRSIPLGN